MSDVCRWCSGNTDVVADECNLCREVIDFINASFGARIEEEERENAERWIENGR